MNNDLEKVRQYRSMMSF